MLSTHCISSVLEGEGEILAVLRVAFDSFCKRGTRKGEEEKEKRIVNSNFCSLEGAATWNSDRYGTW